MYKPERKRKTFLLELPSRMKKLERIEVIREDPTETARKLRLDLKRTFPDTKFSVSTQKQARISSIQVSWYDGPMLCHVRPVATYYEGADIDGMQDMKRKKHYMYEGSAYSGADFIFCNRTLSDERRALIQDHALDLFDDYSAYHNRKEAMENDAEIDLHLRSFMHQHGMEKTQDTWQEQRVKTTQEWHDCQDPDLLHNYFMVHGEMSAMTGYLLILK